MAPMTNEEGSGTKVRLRSVNPEVSEISKLVELLPKPPIKHPSTPDHTPRTAITFSYSISVPEPLLQENVGGRHWLKGFRQNEFIRLHLNSVPKMVDLMVLAAGSERPQLAVARHSQKRAAFPGLETGPVKGMGI